MQSAALIESDRIGSDRIGSAPNKASTDHGHKAMCVMEYPQIRDPEAPPEELGKVLRSQRRPALGSGPAHDRPKHGQPAPSVYINCIA